DKDRKALLNTVKEQFLLNRLVAASQAENTRNLGLQILFNRMEYMALLNTVKEQFILNRLVAASQAENTRNLGLQILFNRMEYMSDKMLLKTIRKLDKGGALDLATITGGPIPRKPSPIVSIHQFGLPGVGSQSLLGDRTSSNPVKDTGMLLEAIEHVAGHYR